MKFELFVLGVVGLVGEDKWLLIFCNFLFEWFRFLLMYYKYPLCHLVMHKVK